MNASSEMQHVFSSDSGVSKSLDFFEFQLLNTFNTSVNFQFQFTVIVLATQNKNSELLGCIQAQSLRQEFYFRLQFEKFPIVLINFLKLFLSKSLTIYYDLPMGHTTLNLLTCEKSENSLINSL